MDKKRLFKISPSWTRAMKGEEKERYEEQVRITLSTKVIEDLVTYLEKERDAYKYDYDYDKPSWSHEQAHNNGYVDAINDVIHKLTLKEPR